MLAWTDRACWRALRLCYTPSRPEARTYLRASQMGDLRAQLSHGPSPVWRPFQVRCGRGVASRLGVAHFEVHLRPPYPRVSLSGQSQREGVLAG